MKHLLLRSKLILLLSISLLGFLFFGQLHIKLYKNKSHLIKKLLLGKI